MLLKRMNKNYDKIVVIDPGKNGVKITVFTPSYEYITHFTFPSSIKKVRNFLNKDTMSDLSFEYIDKDAPNEFYKIGEGIEDGYDLTPSKNTEHHLKCIYCALANVVGEGTKPENIYLILGYPSTDYSNPTLLEDFKNMVSREVKTINLNGVDKKFKVKDLVVYPEGTALIQRSIFPKMRLSIIDIGGENTNFKLYDANGNNLKSFSIDKAGCNHLRNTLEEELRNRVNANEVDVSGLDAENAIREKDIPFLTDGEIQGYDKIEDFIEDAVCDWIENSIFDKLKKYQVNVYTRGTLIIFTGGGSLLLNKYIQELLKDNARSIYISQNCIYDNCSSYLLRDFLDRSKQFLTDEKLIKSRILIYAKIKKTIETFIGNDEKFKVVNNPEILKLLNKNKSK